MVVVSDGPSVEEVVVRGGPLSRWSLLEMVLQ